MSCAELQCTPSLALHLPPRAARLQLDSAATAHTMSTLTRVRVEDATSIGRSYSAKGEVVRGLGESRRKLTSTAWRAAADAHGDISISSYTLAKCHHARATRDDVQAYFDNTWDLTTALFTCLRTDAGFYAIPDVLRRPLIFYAAHPAALYANKMHQAGLIGMPDVCVCVRVRAMEASPTTCHERAGSERAHPPLRAPMPPRAVQTRCTPTTRSCSRRAWTR
ncbi:hypothetical protein EON67_08095 [archaeon]|nr:MAG: hypothetical protein EON67_08095 [archaeon]